MKASTFMHRRAPFWERVEHLVDKAHRYGIHRLSEAELHELVRQYPTLAVDVARCRRYKLDNATQRRVNQLAVAAHGLIYRREPRPVFGTLHFFFRYGFPRLFRKNLVSFVLATAILFAGFTATYSATRIHPEKAYRFVLTQMDLPSTERGMTAEDISERFRRMSRPPMAAGIISNNISVAFTAFALGITAGVGTCYVLLVNSMMLGGFAAHFANHGLSFPFWAFIMPHGVLEILAIVISAAAGIRLGVALAVPGRTSRRQSLRRGAREAVLLVLGTIPMFIIAGLVEGFITPSELPGTLKMVLGVTLGIGAIIYLMIVGRGQRLDMTERASEFRKNSI